MSLLARGRRRDRIGLSSPAPDAWVAKRLTAGVTSTIVVFVAIAAIPSPAASAAANQSCPTALPSEESALQAAVACGGTVAISDLTTETDIAVATADGTIRWDHNYRPVRMRKGDAWAPIDTTLVRTADGRVSPIATTANTSFSGGGDQPMVTVKNGAEALDLDSPLSSLPAPVLAGNTATYSNVLPDVDLQLFADVDGFSQLLVVRNASAAKNPRLKRLTFQVASKGLRLAADSGGNLRALDNNGTVVMTGGGPTMWDAAQNAILRGHPRHGNGRMKRMASEIIGDAITVTPSSEMLNGNDSEFPLYIDPGLTLNRTAWSLVDTNLPTTAYWNSSQEAQIGTLNGGTTKRRSYFAFNMAGTAVAGRNVTAATIQLNETYSGSCTARQFNLYSTGPVSSATTWNNQPALGALQSSATVAKGYSSSCPGGTVTMDATSAVRTAASSGGTVTLGLRAASETDNTYFKRFANNPTLSITYDPLYAVAGTLTTDDAACATGSSRPVVATTTPILSTTFVTSAVPNANTSFEIQKLDGSAIVSGQVPGAPAGSPVIFMVPQNQLALGGTYRWRVRATEDSTFAFGWYGWCEFIVRANFTATFGQDGDLDPWQTPADASPTSDQQLVSSLPNATPVTPYGDEPPLTGEPGDVNAETYPDAADSSETEVFATNVADPAVAGTLSTTTPEAFDSSIDQCSSMTASDGVCNQPATTAESDAAFRIFQSMPADAVSTSAASIDPDIAGAIVTTPDYEFPSRVVSISSSAPSAPLPKSLCSDQSGKWKYGRFEGCLNVVGAVKVRINGQVKGTVTYVQTRYVRVNKKSATFEMHTYLTMTAVTDIGAGVIFKNGGQKCVSVSAPKAYPRKCTTGWNGTGGVAERVGKRIQFDQTITANGLKQNEVHTLYGQQMYDIYMPGAKQTNTHVTAQSQYVWCDQALKGTTQQGCRIQNFVPTLRYKRSGNVSQVATHVQNAIDSQLPNLLTRLYDDTAIKANGDRACPSSFDRPTGYQCDEYPFRSSRQGARIYKTSDYRTFPGCQMGKKWATGSAGFSRCFVLRTQNNKAGNALKSFLNSVPDVGQRILDGEPYKVATVP
jgi:hypothetical protein